MRLFGKKSEMDPDDVVRMMDVTLVMDKKTGDKMAVMKGEYVDGEDFKLVLSPPFARRVCETLLGFLDEENL